MSFLDILRIIGKRRRNGGGSGSTGGGGGSTVEPYWTVAADRGRYCSSSYTSNTSRTDVTRHTASGTLRSLKLHYNAVLVVSGSQQATPTDITRKVSVRLANGTIIEGTWSGGGTTGVIPAGGWAVCEFDLTANPIYKGQPFYIQTFSQVPSGGVIPVSSGDYLSTARGEGFIAGVDTHLTVPSGLSSDYGVFPQVILGLTSTANVKSFALLGDSIITGSTDNLWGVSGTGGWGDRLAILKGFGWANFGRGGDKASIVGPQSVWNQRIDQLQYFSHIICEYGFNDFYVATSTAELQNWVLPLWVRCRTLAPDAKIYGVTITPYGATAPTWPTKDPYRKEFNAWVRDGAPLIGGAPAATGTTNPSAVRAGQVGHPLSGFLDIAVLVEATIAGAPAGYWQDQTKHTDSIHPSTYGHTSISESISSSIVL